MIPTLCPRCHAYVSPEETVCPVCGAAITPSAAPEAGIQAYRQGKRQPAPSPAQPEHPVRARTGQRRPVGEQAPEPPPPEPIHDSRLNGADSYGPGDPSGEGGYERYQPQTTGRTAPGPQPDSLRDSAFQARRGLLGGRRKARTKVRTYEVRSHMINWTHVAIVLVCLLLAAGAGGLLWLRNTPAGHRVRARWHMSTTPVAMWEVGSEYLDQGAVQEAIAMFEAARELDGEEVDVDNLLLLGSAYEAQGETGKAEALYVDLYENIVPNRSEPYANVIRIMLQQGRSQEAADLMQLAWEKTGRATFRTQRTELIPSPPVVNMGAGYYDREISITLGSVEGYDVYYVLDDVSVLPDEGKLYRRPIRLEEGSHTIRAMVMNGELRSDELRAVYQIVMPSPGAPSCNLAPKEYKTRQTVKLRKNKDNENDKDITLYYTVDGSEPDADSPIYTGDPIALPSGRSVWLKAIAVNGYGKMSNTLKVEYKISVPPYPLSAYSTDDKLEGMSLYYTSRADFLNKYGEGESRSDVTLEGFSYTGVRYQYSWGSATFVRKTNTDWILVDLQFHSTQFTAPRGTGYGSTESEIVSQFRDLGQLTSPSGNRGLYYDEKGSGKIYLNEDGTKEIRYVTATADSFYWILSYRLNRNGVCDSVHWSFAKHQ